MTSLLATALELLLAVVYFVAAIGKLTSWQAWLAARRDFADLVPRAVWIGLPAVEAIVAATLALGLRPWSDLGAGALTAIFAVVLAVAAMRGQQGDCNCFGEFMPMRIGWFATVRASGLALIACMVLLLGGTEMKLNPVGLAVSAGAAAMVALADVLWRIARGQGV